MNSAATSSPAALCCLHNQRRSSRSFSSSLHWRPSLRPAEFSSLRIFSSLFHPNRRRRRRLPELYRTTKDSPPLERKVEISIDVDDIADRASAAVTRFYRSTEERIHRFLSSGKDAYHDLRTSVRVDPGHRVVFSCRHSSLLFAANMVLWSFAAFLAVRAVLWIVLREILSIGDRSVIRRDRSLAGREIVVGRRTKGREAEERSYRGLVNPLSPPRGTELKIGDAVSAKRGVKREELPKWWPESVHSPVVSANKLEEQKEADRLVREIMDNRMSGKDFKDNDIIQLRQICKLSGARVSFETENARDSFYRAALNLVLNSSSSVTQPAGMVLIDGEEARQFISGLAYNIGLESVHAARLVRAAVAARTRSLLLQSWALEVQGNRSEALDELSKICQIYHLFPPEEFSPEMEMVAAGLKKNLRVEQRENLLNLFKGVCGAGSQRIAAEALGLIDSS